MLFFDFFSRKTKSQEHPNSLSFQTFILEPILTPSGIIDGPGDDTPDLDGIDSDFPVLDDITLDNLDDVDIIPFANTPTTIADIDSGVFTVGDSGEVSIDFLYDGGGFYKGQLAIFSLDGMENFDLDSPEFIQEAANRALSNSDLGHIVIDDATEGARFSGKTAWENDFNSGAHISDKSFTMRPGDTFAVMLVPNGKVEQIANNPEIGGSIRPLFSLATANPEDAFHVGQIADVTGDGNTFVMEDRRVDGWTDQDYNDIIFRVTGATGEAEDLDNLIADGKDWRSLPSMQELFQHIVDPEDLAGNTPEEARRSSVSSVGKNYRGWVGSLDPDDYYSFTLGARNKFDLSLDGFSEDVNVELLDINENVIVSSSNTGTTPESINGTLSAGAYRVRVSPAGDIIPGTLYDLEMAVTPLIPGVTTTGSDDLNYLFTDESSQLINLNDFRSSSDFDGIDGSDWSTVIIDTGIDLDHLYFGSDADGDGVSDRIILDPNAALDFADNDRFPIDVDDHGSHVASIAASNGYYSGVAPGANIIPLKVFSDFRNPDGTITAKDADIEQALQWTIENAAKYNIASVNLSLGSGNYDSPYLSSLSDEFQVLADLGVISVAASGNSFFQFGSTPGVASRSADPNVISVGAVYDNNVGRAAYDIDRDGIFETIANTTDADRIAPFSQRHGTLTDIVAPGVSIKGANATGGTVDKSGTSMASPHVAGMAVLAQELAVQELGRRLTPDEFRSLLASTGKTINDGDDENDNVNNTGLDFRRADMLKLGEAITNLKTVTATVNRVVGDYDRDYFFNKDRSDFYSILNIDGEKWKSDIIGGKNDISPNWQFSHGVTKTIVPITFQVFDSDGGLRGPDDRVDLNPDPDDLDLKDLNLNFNLVNGRITDRDTGRFYGYRGEQITLEGRVEFGFTIDGWGIGISEPPPVTVAVHRVEGDFDPGLSDSDFYTKISIAGNQWRSPTVGGVDDLRPDWRWGQRINDSVVPITIELFDSDSGLRGKDDRIDINPNAGVKNLNLLYNQDTGRITDRDTGILYGRKGRLINLQGLGDSDRGEIWFSIYGPAR